MQTWAPAGMGKGGTWKCCKVFCAVPPIISALFSQFSKGRSGSFSSFGLVFQGRRLKKGRRLFLRKSAPQKKILNTPKNLPTPGKNPGAPMHAGGPLVSH